MPRFSLSSLIAIVTGVAFLFGALRCAFEAIPIGATGFWTFAFWMTAYLINASLGGTLIAAAVRITREDAKAKRKEG